VEAGRWHPRGRCPVLEWPSVECTQPSSGQARPVPGCQPPAGRQPLAGNPNLLAPRARSLRAAARGSQAGSKPNHGRSATVQGKPQASKPPAGVAAGPLCSPQALTRLIEHSSPPVSDRCRDRCSSHPSCYGLTQPRVALARSRLVGLRVVSERTVVTSLRVDRRTRRQAQHLSHACDGIQQRGVHKRCRQLFRPAFQARQAVCAGPGSVGLPT
jgi:hypothetical protein